MKLPEFNHEQKDFISQFKFDVESEKIFFSNVQSLLREHYEHSRHQEWQRTTFTTILGAIVAAIISSYDKLPPDLLLRLGVFIAGLALSFLGFILMYTWNRPFIRHYYLTEMIVVYYFKLPWLRRTSILDPNKVKMFNSLKDPTSGNVFYVLTSLFTVLFAFLIGYTLDGDQLAILSAIVAVVLLIPIRLYFANSETEERKKILDRHFISDAKGDINKSPFNSSGI